MKADRIAAAQSSVGSVPISAVQEGPVPVGTPPPAPIDLRQGYVPPIHQSWGAPKRGEGMPQMCQQFWPCNAVPPEYVWLMPIIMPLLAIVLLGVPVASILHRAGRSRWWTLIAFIPLLNLIGLWVFAFSRWPTMDRASV